MCVPTLSPRGWWSWQLQTPSWKTTPRNSHWRWQTHRRLLPREIMHTSEPARRAGTRRVPMKSLLAGPGLENANLDSEKVRKGGASATARGSTPPKEIHEGADAQLDDVFGNNGADLRTRKQGVSASNTDERSPKQVYTREESAVWQGKAEGDGKYVATVWKRGCGDSGRLCAYIALPYRPRFEHGETGLHQEHEHRGIVDG